MISLREKVIVRLEIEFELIKGELSIMQQNALDHPLERLVTMWSDQIKQTNLMVLFRRLEKYAITNKSRKRKVSDLE